MIIDKTKESEGMGFQIIGAKIPKKPKKDEKQPKKK